MRVLHDPLPLKPERFKRKIINKLQTNREFFTNPRD